MRQPPSSGSSRTGSAPTHFLPCERGLHAGEFASSSASVIPLIGFITQPLRRPGCRPRRVRTPGGLSVAAASTLRLDYHSSPEHLKNDAVCRLLSDTLRKARLSRHSEAMPTAEDNYRVEVWSDDGNTLVEIISRSPDFNVSLAAWHERSGDDRVICWSTPMQTA